MNPSRLFILRPVATSLLMVAILLAGLVAYRLLPISALPEVDYPTIQVKTLYPGASPDVMTSAITAVFAVPEDRLPAIMQRLRGGEGLKVEAWDRDMKRRLAEGRLLALDSLIDATTGTVKLKAEFANRDGSLFPNQFVNVRLLLDTLSGVVAVPTAALQQGAKGSFVYRLGEGGKVAAVAVTPGPTDGGLAAVESGLAAGDRVVVDGLDKLKDGALVEAVDARAVDAPGRERKRGGGGGRPGH